MIELPRHPKYNAMTGRGSASLGRERLLGVLTAYRLWPQLVELANATYLEPTTDELKQDERNAWLAIAYSQTGDMTKCRKLLNEISVTIASLRVRVSEERECLEEYSTKDKESSSNKGKKRPPHLLLPYEVSEDPFGDENDPSLPKIPSRDADDGQMKDWSDEQKEKAVKLAEAEHRLAKLSQWRFAVESYIAASEGQYKTALELSHQCRPQINSMTRIEWLAQAGYAKKAFDRIKQRVEDSPGELLPLAIGVWIASLNDSKDEGIQSTAKNWCKKLSPLAASADSSALLLDRIVPYIERIGEKENWRATVKPPSDLGDRPSLDSLGPFRWSPPLAPVWSAIDSEGEAKSTKHYGTRPLVLIFYLGIGCVHCAEQLKEFSPLVEQYRAAGIDVAGISTESLQQLQSGLRKYDEEMKITLIANPELDIFRSFRCYDDFEGVPLHGTFLIDTNGRIRWQDIGFKPFMDPKFLLEESTRLLKL
jgi:peroxiredoxin